MARSYSETTGSGATNILTVPFPYISKTHVHVLIDGVELAQGSYTWPSSSTIQLPLAASAYTGKDLRVQRNTPDATPLVTFNSSGLDWADMNTQALQLLYIMQELLDEALSSRTLRVPQGETISDLPAYAEMVGKLLYFDELRRPVGMVPDGVALAQTGPDTVGTVELKIDAVEAENLKSFCILMRHLNPAEFRLPVQANLELYVSRAGSDTTGDGSQGNPYQTAGKAWLDLCYKYDGRGYSATIWLVGTNHLTADFVGPASSFNRVYLKGYGYVAGTVATWDDVWFDPASGSQSVRAAVGAQVECRGFKVQNTVGHGLVAWQQGSLIEYAEINFGACEAVNGCQVWATQGGQIETLGANVVSGGAGCHVAATHDGRYRITNSFPTVVRITYAAANIVFGLAAMYALNAECVLTSIRPVGGAFNPAGFTVTGRQFLIDGKKAAIQAYGEQIPANGDIFGTIAGEVKPQDVYGPKVLGSILTPAINGITPLNDYNPNLGGVNMKEVALVRISAAGATQLTGLFSSGFKNGQCITLVNVGANAWTLKHFNAGSILADRFGLPGGTDIVLNQYDSITLFFDAVSGFWLVASHTK